MDNETRGTIENSLDGIIRNADIEDIAGWIEEEYPITSVTDLVLGYILGSLARFAYQTVLMEKWNKKARKDLEKEVGKAVAKKIYKGLDDFVEDIEPPRVNLGEEDYAEIRGMLKRRIPDIQGTISRELNR